jgi:cold-inducible RNA-binding protein
MLGNESGAIKIDKAIRCDLCVSQGIAKKSQIKAKEQEELEKYERKFRQVQLAPNPDGVTRLYVGNLCKDKTTEENLSGVLSGIYCVQWVNDRKTGTFKGFCFVEMNTAEDAAAAVGRNGVKMLGRSLIIKFQPPDGKSVWPPPVRT